jgi:hypothetical protein
MWQSITEVLVSRTAAGVAIQFGVMLVVTLITMYGILRMRRDNVVILSHGQIMVSTVAATAVCTAVYQGLLWVGPAGRWSSGWALGAVILATMVARMLTMIIVGGIDGGRSLRDTTAGEGGMFNCNWPLISRCANQSLFYLCLIYLVKSEVWKA